MTKIRYSQRKICRIIEYLQERGPSSASQIAKGSKASRYLTAAEVANICIDNPNVFSMTGTKGHPKTISLEGGNA